MIVNYLVVIFLILLSGLFSGLTLGLMSLSPYALKRKEYLGNIYAKKIYKIRKNGNLLLCTLLLGNVAVNSAIAVFLGSITTGVVAGIISTGLIVIFGEILPQSIFSKNALKFGAQTVWIVYIFYYVLYPITKPLATLLDYFVGKELPNSYSKKELNLLFKDQLNNKGTDITQDEAKFIENSLFFSEKKVEDIMTPRINTYFLHENDILDMSKLQDISNRGHSRIPVYKNDKDTVVGILYAKDLIKVDHTKSILAKDIMRKHIVCVKENYKLNKILELFKAKRVHIMVVKDQFNGVAGIVTLEDVLEEIVGEIIDEFDRVIDMRKLNSVH